MADIILDIRLDDHHGSLSIDLEYSPTPTRKPLQQHLLLPKTRTRPQHVKARPGTTRGPSPIREEDDDEIQVIEMQPIPAQEARRSHHTCLDMPRSSIFKEIFETTVEGESLDPDAFNWLRNVQQRTPFKIGFEDVPKFWPTVKAWWRGPDLSDPRRWLRPLSEDTFKETQAWDKPYKYVAESKTQTRARRLREKFRRQRHELTSFYLGPIPRTLAPDAEIPPWTKFFDG
jgi:hypothetical protein